MQEQLATLTIELGTDYDLTVWTRLTFQNTWEEQAVSLVHDCTKMVT